MWFKINAQMWLVINAQMWQPAGGIGNRWQSMSGECEQQEQGKQLLHHVRSLSLKDTKTLKEHLGILDVGELMLQRADCSRMEAPELLKEVTFQDFTESLKIVANLMSIRSGARPSGSSKFVACAYPGDIDCCEDIVYPPSVTKQEAAEMLASRIKDMMHRVQLRPDIFLADFKAGFDQRIRGLRDYLTPSGKDEGDVPDSWPKKKFLELLQERHGKGEISPENYQKILEMAEATPENLTAGAGDDDGTSRAPSSIFQGTDAKDSWLRLHGAIGDLSKVRWKHRHEIGAGEIELYGGVKKTLVDAVSEGSMVKIDLWAPFTDRHGFFKYTEVTNVFIATRAPSYDTTTPDQLEPLTKLPQPKDPIMSLECVDHDIRHYDEPGHGQDFIKVIKRIWLKMELWRKWMVDHSAVVEAKCPTLTDDTVREALRVIYGFFQLPECMLIQAHTHANKHAHAGTHAFTCAQVRDESEVVRKVVNEFILDHSMPPNIRSKLVCSLLEQVVGFKKRVKTALANEAFLMQNLAELPMLQNKVKEGMLISIPGYPKKLDTLLDPIWDGLPADLKWGSFTMPPDKCWKDWCEQLQKSLKEMEKQLSTSANEGGKLWIHANVQKLLPIFPGLEDLVNAK